MTDMLKAALGYATQRDGWRPLPVFPLATNSKVPRKGSRGCRDATTDAAKISAWWEKTPSANIGLATGKASGLLVLDVDRKGGLDGMETVHFLEAQLGKLPETWTQLTPSGGVHYAFRYPGIPGMDFADCASGGGLKDEAGALLYPGLDVRAEGGYVVAAPSRVNGKVYEWDAGALPSETSLAELPSAWVDWLLLICGKPSTSGRTVTAEVVRRGGRNSALISYAGKLRAQSMPDEKILASLRAFNAEHCAPPLDDREVVTVWRSILRYPAGTSTHTSRERLTVEALSAAMAEMGYAVRFNLLTKEPELSGSAGLIASMGDLLVPLHSELADRFKGATMDILGQYVGYISRKNSFNPVLDLLRATPWDGKDRVSELFDLMGISGDDLSKVLVRKWLLQTVALLFNTREEPFGADGVLVLNGAQGTGKTSLLRRLALRPAWFGEGLSIDDRDKDTLRRCVSVWIGELGEVESTLKSDISRLKAFITSDVDRYRLPYGREDIKAPRLTSLAATCNSDRYLIDTTNNRRWWSVPFEKAIRYEEILQFNALQLWAEIFAEVNPLSYSDKAACFRLTTDERSALDVRNRVFEKPMKAQTEVEDILAQAGNVNLRAVTCTMFKEAYPALRAYSAVQIGAVLKKLGFDGTHRKNGTVYLLPMP